MRQTGLSRDAGVPLFAILFSCLVLGISQIAHGEIVRQEEDERAPLIIEEPPPVEFAVSADDTSCSPDYVGQTRVLLIGLGEIAEHQLSFPAVYNDLRLLEDVLSQNGATVNVLRDPSRAELVSQLQALIESTGCGDTIFLHFGGVAMTVDQWRQQAWSIYQHTEVRFTGTESQVVFVTSDASPVDTETTGADIGLRDVDLASAIAALRNRGGFVFVSLDTIYAAAFDLFQQFHGSDLWTLPDGGGPRLVPGAAGMAVFYAAAEDEVTFDIELPLGPDGEFVDDAVIHGPFSYSMAGALATGGQDVSIRQLADSMNRTYQDIVQMRRLGVNPRYESTDPAHRLFTTRSSAGSSELGVTIIAPELTRGLGMPSDQGIVLEGRLADTNGLVSLLVDSRPVPVRGDGYFRVPLSLSPSGTSLTLVGLYAESGKYASRVVEVPYEFADALESAAEAGKRYALLIGNQNYSSDSGYRSLRTPHEDVDVLARLLSEGYGFETSIEIDGAERSLVLKDASRNEILSSVDALRRHLSENDTLLVFYAGHGSYDERAKTAFWVPADAGADQFFNLIPANDITMQLRMMDARHVLVVSDSCYSGGLTRSGGETEQVRLDESDGRDNYLRALLERRSRALLSSGADEPVWDGGGGNHSVFAAALIRGLDEMRGETFTAEELYSLYLRESVAGSSEQIPQYQYLQQSGHDGGGFLFFGEAAD